MLKRIFVLPYQGRQKKGYFEKLNLEKLTDNKNFWRTVMKFFRDKGIN